MDKNRFLIELSGSERTDFLRVDFEKQSLPQKVFSAIWELESQVNNSGFHQYFCNCEFGVIVFAPVALRTIGAISCAGIVERAIALISPLPSTRMSRLDALDALSEIGVNRLDALDSEFWAYPDDLTELLFRYVNEHPASFGPLAETDTA